MLLVNILFHWAQVSEILENSHNSFPWNVQSVCVFIAHGLTQIEMQFFPAFDLYTGGYTCFESDSKRKPEHFPLLRPGCR